MTNLPRFVQKRKQPKSAASYRFNPPQYLVDAGVVSRKEWGSDLKQVKVLAKELNDKIDKYREEQAQLITIKPSSTVADLSHYYYASNDYKALRPTTKVDYAYFIGLLVDAIGHRKHTTVTSKVAKQLYEQWVERGISYANHGATCASRVFNYAIAMEQIQFNPFSNIKRKAAPQRKVVWKHSDVTKFLDVAFDQYRYRNIGMIVMMAYKWTQRLGDMRNLTWDTIDFDKQMLCLEQSKRRAEVFLPIDDELFSMLQEQHEDLGFQPYVAPHPEPVAGGFQPYAMERLSKVGRKVMREAGLPEKLRLMDLRRTGVTEMMEAGVPLPQIMSVTGHNHVSSVKPYMKNTYLSANNALTARYAHVKSNTESNIGK
jgi:integrase|tara:strand:- start:171 stop:1286 length:1116 start_codon:yes stop_codon:yes gene_type:complete